MPTGPATGESWPRGSGDFLRRWAAVTLAAAAIVSAADAVLLQKTRSLFTGGFLSEDHLHGIADISAFAAVSLVTDAAVAGALVAVTMWLLARRRVRTRACIVAGLMAGVGPLLAADVISLELVRYLGDAFDLSLMFDLSGRNPREILAVASSHLAIPGLAVAGAVAAAGGCVWLVNRHSGHRRMTPARAAVLRLPLLLAAVGLATVSVAGAAGDAVENGVRRKPAGRALALVMRMASDVDRDGFGIGGTLPDPDLTNASVYPYAIDIPGNGVDEDGIGGDLPLDQTPYVERGSQAPWARRPDVVLVVLESFRADLVGAKANGRPVTPVLDALAARGTSSAHAYSHNGYTAQSRYHIFSGSLAGVRDGRSLVDDFKAAGYTVAYFSGQDESFGGPEYAVGFDRADVSYDARVDRGRRYSTFTTAGSLAVPFPVVQERVGEFLRGRGADRSRPLFLYVNFHDTHFPYSHDAVQTLTSPIRLPRGQIAPETRDELWATYANTAANVDRAIGETLDAVRQARGAEPAVVVTGDHGESLFDEGFLGHGYALNEVQTRVPLIVANLPMVVREPFGQRDLRDALGDALRVAPEVSAQPRLQPTGGELFQYLGTIARPRQIAFQRHDGRIIYDFRSGRVQVGAAPPQRPENLPAAEHGEFLRLIREWERMILARRSIGARDE